MDTVDWGNVDGTKCVLSVKQTPLIVLSLYTPFPGLNLMCVTVSAQVYIDREWEGYDCANNGDKSVLEEEVCVRLPQGGGDI